MSSCVTRLEAGSRGRSLLPVRRSVPGVVENVSRVSRMMYLPSHDAFSSVVSGSSNPSEEVSTDCHLDHNTSDGPPSSWSSPITFPIVFPVSRPIGFAFLLSREFCTCYSISPAQRSSNPPKALYRTASGCTHIPQASPAPISLLIQTPMYSPICSHRPSSPYLRTNLRIPTD